MSNNDKPEPPKPTPRPTPQPARPATPSAPKPVQTAAKVAETHAPAFEALAETAPAPVAKAAEPAPAPAPVKAAEPPKPQPGIWKRVQPTMIYPPLLAKLEMLVANCEKRGARYYAICGFRSAEEQADLYAQGRSKPGKKVTNAKPYSSLHQFHVAVDFCRDADMDREGLQPDWNLESYRILAEEAQKLGLESAFFWKTFQEGPHVQLPIGKMGLTIDQLKSVYLAGGQKALYALLDKYQW